MSAHGGVVHQILFCWTERSLTESSGVGPAASSLTSAANLATWEQRLLAADWAAAEVTGREKRPVLIYLRFAGQAVVLRKMTVTDPHGRAGSPLAHALIGDESFLGPQVALGLHDWSGWIREETRPAELGTLDAGQLQRAAQRGYQGLRDRARRLDPRLLAALTATVLSDPSGRFSVIIPEDGQAPVLGAELMCGMLDVLAGTVDQEWTFSTGEAEEPAAVGRPQYVFLFQAPGFSTRAPTGHRVEIGQTAWFGAQAEAKEAQALSTFGAALADVYAQLGPEAIDRLRPGQPIASAQSAFSWAEAAQFVPGVLADYDYLLWAAGCGRLDPRVVEQLGDQHGTVTAVLAAMPGEDFRRLAAAWGPGATAVSTYPDIAEAIQREAAWRYVAASREPDQVRSQLADQRIVVELGVRPATLLEQLTRYGAEFGVETVGGAAHRIVTLVTSAYDTEIVTEVRNLPPAVLLVLADDCAAERPALGERLLTTVSGHHPLTPQERAACRDQLLERDFLVSAVERFYPNDPGAAGRCFAHVIDLVFGPDLDQPNVVKWILAHISRLRSAPLLWGLAERVPAPLRGRVLSEGGNMWFADNGLVPLSTEVEEKQDEEEEKQDPPVQPGAPGEVPLGKSPPVDGAAPPAGRAEDSSASGSVRAIGSGSEFAGQASPQPSAGRQGKPFWPLRQALPIWSAKVSVLVAALAFAGVVVLILFVVKGNPR